MRKLLPFVILAATVALGACGGPKAVSEQQQRDETEQMQRNSPDLKEP